MAHEHHGHDEHDHGHGYPAEVEAYRAAKDAHFKHSPASPIPEDARPAFGGIAYFPVDPALRFEDLGLDPYHGSEPVAFHIPTSDGRLRPAHRAGSFSFDLAGEPRPLAAYVLDGGEDGSLFVPFLDATSGHETYGAGRYLDVAAEADGTFVLDFNLAYHPYCVYNPAFSCPLTPAENRLPVAVAAGERLPDERLPDETASDCGDPVSRSTGARSGATRCTSSLPT